MANHVLYIGLGGTGVHTIAHIRRLYWAAQRRGDTSFRAEFLYADTDSEMKKQLASAFLHEFSLDPGFIDFQSDWIDLGGFNPNTVWANLRAERLPHSADVKAWMNPDAAERFESKIVSIGADARRQLGRLCFVHNLEPIRTKLAAKLNRWSDVKVGELQIVIATSSCGGTGSSVFFDFCYLASVLGAERLRALPQIRPIIVSPQGYIESVKSMQGGTELIQRMKANAYAFFLELQHARGRKGPQHELFAAPSSEHIQAFHDNWRPFQAGMVFDVQLEGTSWFLTLRQLPQVIGEMVYHLHSASGDAKVEQVFTNMDSSVTDYFMTLGMKALNYPAGEIADYLCVRLAHDVVSGRFLSVGASEKEVQDEAQRLVGAAVRPLDAVRDERWRAIAAPVLERIADFGSFLVPGEEDAEVDPSAVTKGQVDAWNDELKREVESVKSQARADYQSWAGAPTSGGGQYDQCRSLLLEAMENAVDRWGVSSWVGWRAEADRPGLALRFAEGVEARARAAHERLIESSRAVVQLEEAIRDKGAELVALAEGGGLFKRLTGSTRKQLRTRLAALGELRKKAVEQQLRNELLKREVEFLTWVGSRGSVRPEDFFLHKRAEPGRSLVGELLEHGLRIQAWLGEANTALRTRLDATVESLSRSTPFVVFDPPLDSMIVGFGAAPSGTVGNALKMLAALVGKEGAAFRRFTDGGWRRVRPTEVERSDDALVEFQTGISEWVRAQLREPNQKDLSAIGLRTLENHLNGLSPTRRKQLNEQMAGGAVSVFCPVGPAVSTSKPFLRMMVTADDGSRPDGAAQLLGYKPGDGAQVHLRDVGKPHRAVAIKLYHKLSMADFPWMETLRSAYEGLIDYEPHLWRDGRVRLALGLDSADRLQRAFALAVLWASVLKRKWNSEFAGYFTAKLADQPDGFLHDGPVALRGDNTLLVLRGDLAVLSGEPGAINAADARLGIPATRVRYDKLADPRAFHVAYPAFMKSRETLANAEWFQRHFAGVQEAWPDGILVIQVTNEARARKFLDEALEFVGSGLMPLRDQLEAAAVREAVRDQRAVVGQMITALKSEVEKVREALAGNLI